MEQKYYWYITISDGPNGGVNYRTFVTGQHPILLELNEGRKDEILLNWKEITREEYDLFNSK